MARIRSRGNAATEVALAKLFRRHKITGWRRHVKLRVTSDEWQVKSKRRTSPRPSPQKNVSPRQPSPGFATLSRSHGRGTQRGEGENRASASSPVTRHSSLAVRPDFVFPKSRTAVFVDGCFWHGCPKHATQPKGNRAFWKKKFARNRARDRLVNRALRSANWQVLRIWEHTLRWATKKPQNEAQLLRRFRRILL